jgi:hypothetical protein
MAGEYKKLYNEAVGAKYWDDKIKYDTMERSSSGHWKRKINTKL